MNITSSGPEIKYNYLYASQILLTKFAKIYFQVLGDIEIAQSMQKEKPKGQKKVRTLCR